MKTQKRSSNPKKARTQKAPMNGGKLWASVYKYRSFVDIHELEKGYFFKIRDGKIWIVLTVTNREYDFDSYKYKFIDCFDVCIDTMMNYYKNKTDFIYAKYKYYILPRCLYDYMYLIFSYDDTCNQLSTYIRHMKKIIMNYYTETSHLGVKFKIPRYPEWNTLPQPRIEWGLNKMMDEQFCNDIEMRKFTLKKKDINSNEAVFPGFHNPHNKKQDTYTSFTIDINTVDENEKKYIAMEHNKLLLWLEEHYCENTVTLDINGIFIAPLVYKNQYYLEEDQIPGRTFEIRYYLEEEQQSNRVKDLLF